MNRNQKQTEQKTKQNTNICCMECGTTRGKMHKIKKRDGTRGCLCQYCFEEYMSNNDT